MGRQTEVSTSDKKVMVGLYLKGQDLDPNKITDILGLTPTVSHRRDEVKRTFSGREIVTKIGFWGLVIDKEPAEVSEVVASLIVTLGHREESFAKLAGVQEAYFDIFVAADSDEDGDGTCQMYLTSEQVQALSRYRLPIRFTVSLCKP